MNVAIHEAGHAVVAIVRGFELRSASIVARGSSPGRTLLARRYGDYDAKDLLVWALAGGQAEQKFSKQPAKYDSDDLSIARDLALVLTDGVGTDTDRVIRHAALFASNEVERHWKWIERTAKALTIQRELEAAEILELRFNPVVEEAA